MAEKLQSILNLSVFSFVLNLRARIDLCSTFCAKCFGPITFLSWKALVSEQPNHPKPHKEEGWLLRGIREEARIKLIALQETFGATTAETSSFLLGPRIHVARRWLLGWSCHASSATLWCAGRRGVDKLSVSVRKRTSKAKRIYKNQQSLTQSNVGGD